ncbi:hypothetical protein MNBD_GAMMA07-393 [hydrothermal vent metagenome]|uniref:N-acetyltransferase domain-containing protein n=1 Tax=hydrothermal vent metagenome TaxID=652676 RepID=A0A3B0WY04_9ZZZZ
MKLKIEKLQQKDIITVSKLIDNSFIASVAPTLTDEGIVNFQKGITPESIKERLLKGNIFIVCKHNNIIVGVGEIRNNNHLNLLFVEPSEQKKGIGRKLILSLIKDVTQSVITVNSSLNAVAAYKKLGFKISASQSEIKGIKYQPMGYVKT